MIANIEQATPGGGARLAQVHYHAGRDGRPIARLHHHDTHHVILVLGKSQLLRERERE